MDEVKKHDINDDHANDLYLKNEKEPVMESAEEKSVSTEKDTQDLHRVDENPAGLTQEEIADEFSFDKKDAKIDEVRQDIAEKFKERVGMESEKEQYEAIQPQLKTNYWWTIILVIIITICLGVIVFLLVTKGTTKDMLNINDQILSFNEKKSRYDQSLVDAVNSILAAGASYNQGKYADANDQAKDAERSFSTTLDYLYDLRTIDLGTEYSFLDSYYEHLEEAAVAGEEMGEALAFSARSADRGQADEAKSSLHDYEGFMRDFTDASKKIDQLVKDNNKFFVE